MKPGVYESVSSELYHADDFGDTPSLSASMACILVNQSPAHARAAHPKLNPDYEAKDESKFDLGRASHALLLEGEANTEVFDYDNWRTKDSQEDARLARQHGKTPMLRKDWVNCEAMVAAIRAELPKWPAEPPLFVNGKPEQTMIWDENGVTCRARIDWLHDDLSAIDDLKTTSRIARPEKWSRGPLYDHGADVQAALYLRGIRALTGATPAWRWCVVETAPPYALSVIRPGADVLALADAKVDKALAIWKACLKHNKWPAYPAEVFEAELPPWLESQWLEREAREDVAA